MRERLRLAQTRRIRNSRMRSGIDDNLVAAQRARLAIVQLRFDGFRRNETPSARDQLGTARCIRLQVKRNFTFGHAALALADLQRATTNDVCMPIS
jgi:hypothetical protein